MSISIRDLAAQLADEYEVEADVMLGIVTTYAEQVNDAASLWDENAEELTEAGEEFVRNSIVAWYADPDTNDAVVSELYDAQEAVDSHDGQIHRRNNAVRAAVAAGVPVVQIAEITNLTRARIYQIRDGRR